MPTQSFEDLHRSLQQGEVEPVYYLYGPEDILKSDAATAILDRVLEPAYRDLNFDQRTAAQLNAESLETLLYSLPMLATKRVVCLREVEVLTAKALTRAVLLRYLEQPASDTVVILMQGSAEETQDADLTRVAYTVACLPLPPERVVRWLHHRARRQGFSFGPGAAEHLAALAGHDLARLATEVLKFAALAEDGPLTVEKVGEIAGVPHGETLHDWRDAVLDGRTDRALHLGGRVLDQAGLTAVRMVSTLGSSLIGVGLARGLWDRGHQRPSDGLSQEVGRILATRVRPFAWMKDVSWRVEAERWARWAQNWPAPRIQRGLAATLEADRALKSPRVSEDRSILCNLVLQLAPAQREEP